MFIQLGIGNPPINTFGEPWVIIPGVPGGTHGSLPMTSPAAIAAASVASCAAPTWALMASAACIAGSCSWLASIASPTAEAACATVPAATIAPIATSNALRAAAITPRAAAPAGGTGLQW